jgi:hypothetical protein
MMGLLLLLSASAAVPSPVLWVDRMARVAYVLSDSGTVLEQTAAGIGRGGLGEKSSMADRISPTGHFTVDLILTRSGSHNAVMADVVQRFSSEPAYAALLSTPAGLSQLFENMSRLDFDGDGAPDRAYGDGYIGLRSSEAVTGPKMRRYRGTPYWYAIALHGTPDPSSLGEARSGGCVHLPASLLEQLVTGDHIQLGTEVIIADGPPLPLNGVGGGAVP